MTTSALGSDRTGMHAMPQIDSLRAFAVLTVILQHCFPPGTVKLGEIGVRLFFVISGFLITGILLSARHRAE